MAQMLNCILSMVEKTRRALAILQQRSYDHNTSSSAAAVVASTSWQKHQQIRRDETSELRRQAGELIAQTIKATEDRVIQVKRKAGLNLRRYLTAGYIHFKILQRKQFMTSDEQQWLNFRGLFQLNDCVPSVWPLKPVVRERKRLCSLLVVTVKPKRSAQC